MSLSIHRELTRRRYLDAMGITCYLARAALPGAAPAQRLAVQQSASPPQPTTATAAAPRVRSAPAATQLANLVGSPASPAPEQAQPEGVGQKVASQGGTQFSLAVLFAGGLAWLEDLQGGALARDQVDLVQAMARAVSGSAELAGSVQFDWPPHRNPQFDLGPEAASASLAGFLGRQVEQRQCRGIVLLGEGHTTLVPADQFPSLRVVSTLSSADMLADPSLKRRVWQDLQPLLQRA